MNQQAQKPKPTNDIDLQMMTTEPFISSEYMSENIKNKFRKYSYVLDDNGEIILDEHGHPEIKLVVDLWATIEIYTQDIRLGNMNEHEIYFARYHLDLCSDILTTLPASFQKSSFIALQRAINTIETSQSKGGFLRRLFNSFFQHQKQTIEEQPQKRSLLGFGKKKTESY